MHSSCQELREQDGCSGETSAWPRRREATSMANALAPERKPTPLSTSKVQSQDPGICLQSEQACPSVVARTRLTLALARLHPGVLLDSETHNKPCATAARAPPEAMEPASSGTSMLYCSHGMAAPLHSHPPDNLTGKMTRAEKRSADNTLLFYVWSRAERPCEVRWGHDRPHGPAHPQETTVASLGLLTTRLILALALNELQLVFQPSHKKHSKFFQWDPVNCLVPCIPQGLREDIQTLIPGWAYSN